MRTLRVARHTKGPRRSTSVPSLSTPPAAAAQAEAKQGQAERKTETHILDLQIKLTKFAALSNVKFELKVLLFFGERQEGARALSSKRYSGFQNLKLQIWQRLKYSNSN